MGFPRHSRTLFYFFLFLVPGVFGQGAWVLTWSDEFEVDGAPDPQNWGYEEGYVRNNEHQYYTRDRRENARVEGGHLIVEARRDNWQGHEYTSASLITRGKHSWTFGRFELRAKIDIRRGSWPAWWTVGTSRGWPQGGEIDMMEFYQGKILFNTYCGDNCNGGWDSQTRNVDEAWAANFHIWRMDWTEDSIKLFIDDTLANTTDLSQTITGGNNPFHEPHYMFINQAIGGNQGGDPSQTEFPIIYQVDYVRVYEWDEEAISIHRQNTPPGQLVLHQTAQSLEIKVPSEHLHQPISIVDIQGRIQTTFQGNTSYHWIPKSNQPGVYFVDWGLGPPQKIVVHLIP